MWVLHKCWCMCTYCVIPLSCSEDGVHEQCSPSLCCHGDIHLVVLSQHSLQCPTTPSTSGQREEEGVSKSNQTNCPVRNHQTTEIYEVLYKLHKAFEIKILVEAWERGYKHTHTVSQTHTHTQRYTHTSKSAQGSGHIPLPFLQSVRAPLSIRSHRNVQISFICVQLYIVSKDTEDVNSQSLLQSYWRSGSESTHFGAFRIRIHILYSMGYGR